MTWVESGGRGRGPAGSRLHGALFDLNAFYAKRLVRQVMPDNTIARQCPFLSHFTSTATGLGEGARTVVDVMVNDVGRFAASASLKETIDQVRGGSGL
jgi:hypothetical protein